MAPPSAARVAWDVEQLSTVPAELGGHEVQGARVELVIRPAPDLVIHEDVRFEVRLDAGNYPARPPAVRRLTENVEAVDGINEAGSVNLPILDPRAEPNGWSRGYSLAVVFYALRDAYRKAEPDWAPPPPHVRGSSEPAAGRPALPSNLSFGLTVGHAGDQGKRVSMEDVVLIKPLDVPSKKTRRAQLIVVFDGHGGRKVAEWAAELLPEELQRNLRVDGWGDALKRAFPAVDAELRRRREADSMGRDASGSTVLAALFDGRDAFHVASLGDCRAVLAEKDGYVNCSNDCRADRPDEVARVVRAGGFVKKMFSEASAFNQDLSDWRLDSVTDIDRMFYKASAFDQDLGWCVDYGVSIEGAFESSGCESTWCGVTHGICWGRGTNRSGVGLVLVIVICLLLAICVPLAISFCFLAGTGGACIRFCWKKHKKTHMDGVAGAASSVSNSTDTFF